jgi:FkbM family methyltransferase
MVRAMAEVGASTTLGRLTTRVVAGLLPDRALAVALRRVYPRIEPELRHLPELIAGGTALDVGAWYGPWSYRLRRHAERVVAVEPNPRLAALLRSSLPGVHVVEAALGDHSGEVPLYIPPGRGREGVASLTPAASMTGTTVPMRTLDELGLTDLRLVKLDVEGHELGALRGGERTIRRDRPTLLVEVEVRMQPVGPVLDLLTGWGYAASVLIDGSWRELAGYDLAGHQREMAGALSHTLIRRVVWPRPRYVNVVRFCPL